MLSACITANAKARRLQLEAIARSSLLMLHVEKRKTGSHFCATCLKEKAGEPPASFTFCQTSL